MSRAFALYSLAVINFSHIIDSMLIMPMGDIFIRSFDLNAQEYSYLVSSYALGAVISSILAFFYLDRYDRKTALIFLYAGFVLGTLMCGFAQDYYVLVALRFTTGVFGGVIGALAFTVASDLYPFHERGRAMGILVGAFSAASALGVPFGLYLAATFNWRMPFFCLGGLGGILLILIIIKFPNIRAHLEIQKDVSFSRTIHLITSDNNQLMALLLGMVLVLGHFMIIPFISPYMIRNVGFTQLEITYVFLLGGLALVFSAPLVGKLTDRIGVMKVFTAAILLSFIPTLAITYMQASPIWYALIFTTLFFIFASSRMIPANTMITASVGNENRGSFMSMKSALQQLAIGTAALISGKIVIIGKSDGLYYNYPYLAYISIFFCLISIWLCSKLKVAKGN